MPIVTITTLYKKVNPTTLVPSENATMYKYELQVNKDGDIDSTSLQKNVDKFIKDDNNETAQGRMEIARSRSIGEHADKVAAKFHAAAQAKRSGHSKATPRSRYRMT